MLAGLDDDDAFGILVGWVEQDTMVADPPEQHLGCHALVDAIRQLFDEAGVCFSSRELNGAATVKLILVTRSQRHAQSGSPKACSPI
jgi:hypothetical protein